MATTYNEIKLQKGRFKLEIIKKFLMVRRVKEWNRLLRNTVESPSLFNLSHKLSNDFQKVSSKLHAAVDRRISG